VEKKIEMMKRIDRHDDEEDRDGDRDDDEDR
jgi:hypothetical protein